MARRKRQDEPPTPPASVEQQQAWDHEETVVRLDALASSIVQVDDLVAKVRELTAALARAKRDLKDAQLRQRIAARREIERRRPKPPATV